MPLYLYIGGRNEVSKKVEFVCLDIVSETMEAHDDVKRKFRIFAFLVI